MTAGVLAAIVMKFTVPDAWVLYFFPVLFGVSLIGCIAGTYSAPPTDDETLINFYTRVRPWGWWKPIEEKLWLVTLISSQIRTSREMLLM